MSDTIGVDGLNVKTLSELREELTTDFQNIYGENINLDQNSPDGQILNIIAQEGTDIRSVVTQVNAGFDPDQAQGRVLDQRVAINGIRRNAGTYTFVTVNITVDRAVNLVGLDDQAAEAIPTVANLFTVRDDAGTEFYLLESQNFTMAGTTGVTFRAANIGRVEVTINTITTISTVTAGVTGVNNPAGADSLGVDEESDQDLQDRRRSSVSIPSLGFLDSLEATLNDLDGVTTARVFENDTSVTDSNGIPPHSIWAIVEGGAPADIGQSIYVKKTAGAGMRGTQSVNVPRPDGSTYEVLFDRPGSEDLYIRFSLQVIGGGTVDFDEIKRQIVSGIIWGVGEDAAADEVIEFLKNINTNYRITGMQLSKDDSTYLEVVAPDSVQNRFVNDVSRITIT